MPIQSSHGRRDGCYRMFAETPSGRRIWAIWRYDQEDDEVPDVFGDLSETLAGDHRRVAEILIQLEIRALDWTNAYGVSPKRRGVRTRRANVSLDHVDQFVHDTATRLALPLPPEPVAVHANPTTAGRCGRADHVVSEEQASHGYRYPCQGRHVKSIIQGCIIRVLSCCYLLDGCYFFLR